MIDILPALKVPRQCPLTLLIKVFEAEARVNKGKGIRLHAMEAHGGREGIAPIHT
jgi:hypothetical protein